MKRMPAEFETKPTGLLVYRPPGDRAFNFPKWLIREFVFQFVEALLAAWLLAQASLGSFGKRVLFVTVIGIIAAITTNMSYWNWYGFTRIYTIGYMTIQVIGFFCAGLVAALILKPRARV